MKVPAVRMIDKHYKIKKKIDNIKVMNEKDESYTALKRL